MVELRGPGGKALISGALVVALVVAIFAVVGFPRSRTAPPETCPAPVQYRAGLGNGTVYYNFTKVEDGPWGLDATRYRFEASDRAQDDPPPPDTFANASRRGEDARVYYRDLSDPGDRLNVGDMLVLNDHPPYDLDLEGPDGRTYDLGGCA